MKGGGYFILFVLFCLQFLLAPAQLTFRTIVPMHPISYGESFQVQYVLENGEQVSNFSPPTFSGFRIVAGPNIYSGKKIVSGNKSLPYNNWVFTLAPTNEGWYKIKGALCVVNGTVLKSNDSFVKIVSSGERDESPYFLKPEEDPFKKIQNNLFLKLIINKQDCFIGEPLVATFKLYSRLQSKSNVIKNPAFYGFSVYDMINLDDRIRTEERLKGQWYDVHIIRKVQLYPLQAGTFTIDPMEVANQVEFSRTVVSKNTEQQVTENMYGDRELNSNEKEGSEVYEMNIKSNPLTVKVKPFPSRNVADTFAGAVGDFTIRATLNKDSLHLNEEGSLVVDIKGQGNFQRVNPPIIHWPRGFENFEPSTEDTLDKQTVPLAGQRRFKFAFVSAKPGKFIIPEISFSFFHLGTKTYRTVSTKPLTVFILSAQRENKTPPSNNLSPKSNVSPVIWWIPAIALLVFTAMAFGVRTRRQTRKRELIQQERSSSELVSIEQILVNARETLDGPEKYFYIALNQSIRNYLYLRFGIFASQINDEKLKDMLGKKQVPVSVISQLQEIIYKCGTGVYTNAELHFDKKQLLQQAKEIMEKIDGYTI